MSDSGFPPFRSAPPKGQPKPQPQPQPAAPTQTRPPLPMDEELPVAAAAEDRPIEHAMDALAKEIDHASYQAPQRIAICAHCGSRKVRDAILVDGDVYVKL